MHSGLNSATEFLEDRTLLTGILTVDGNVSLDPGGSFDVEINGTTPGTDHDQLRVTGANRIVSLNSATLNTTVGYVPAHNDFYVIIDNVDSSSMIAGTFDGLNEGDSLTVGDELFFVTYMGGTDNNDVVLTNQKLVTVAGSSASVVEDGVSNLAYTFTRTGTTTGTLTVDFSVTGQAGFETDYTQTGAASFTASAGSVTIADGNASATVTIDPVTDAVFELDETVTLTVVNGSGYVAGAVNSDTGTITNDDNALDAMIDGGGNLVIGESGGNTIDILTLRNSPEITSGFQVPWGMAV
jgi:hypothetical protein